MNACHEQYSLDFWDEESENLELLIGISKVEGWTLQIPTADPATMGSAGACRFARLRTTPSQSKLILILGRPLKLGLLKWPGSGIRNAYYLCERLKIRKV